MTTKEVMQWVLTANSAEREAVALVMRAVELSPQAPQAVVEMPMKNGPTMQFAVDAKALKTPGQYTMKTVGVRPATDAPANGFKYQPKSPLMKMAWALLQKSSDSLSPAELTRYARNKMGKFAATEADMNSVGIQLRKLSERKHSPVKRVKHGRTFLYSVKHG